MKAITLQNLKLNMHVLPVLFLTAGFASAATVTFDAVTLGSLGAVNGATTDAPFDRTDGWSRSTSNGTGTIITTSTSGLYTGGRALSGDVNNSAVTYIGGKLGIIDTAVGNTISFDLRFEGGDTITAGFMGNADLDGLYDQSTPDSGMQFGVNAGSVVARYASFGSSPTLTGITNSALTAGKWYGFDITIDEVLSGERTISMTVQNLTDNLFIDLNGASAGNAYTFTASVANFGVAPEDAVGGYVRVTQLSNGANRGTIDNLAFTAIPEPSAALLGGLGMLMLLRRRR